VLNLPAHYLHAAGVNLDHYKMIKEQEAAARARLIAERGKALKQEKIVFKPS
jgi:hypothetical protein